MCFINSTVFYFSGTNAGEGRETCPDLAVLRYLSIDPKNERAPAYRNRIPEASPRQQVAPRNSSMSSGMNGEGDERKRERERVRAPASGGRHGSLPPLSLDFSSVCGGITREKGAGSFENTRVVAGVALRCAAHGDPSMPRNAGF